MDFRDNCGIVYDPRIIETVKNVQVQFYPDFLRNTSFLLILDKKVRFNRAFCFYKLVHIGLFFVTGYEKWMILFERLSLVFQN